MVFEAVWPFCTKTGKSEISTIFAKNVQNFDTFLHTFLHFCTCLAPVPKVHFLMFCYGNPGFFRKNSFSTNLIPRSKTAKKFCTKSVFGKFPKRTCFSRTSSLWCPEFWHFCAPISHVYNLQMLCKKVCTI